MAFLTATYEKVVRLFIDYQNILLPIYKRKTTSIAEITPRTRLLTKTRRGAGDIPSEPHKTVSNVAIFFIQRGILNVDFLAHKIIKR